MARWLFKQEPDCYAFSDLERDGRTVWDGISNALALKHLRSVEVGDEVLYYHTGDEKAIVGVMKVVKGPEPDPTQDNEKLVVVTVEFVRRLAIPVTLAAIKADPAFADWGLVKMSRLSVVPTTDAIWNKIEAMSGGVAIVEKKAMGKRK